MFWYKLDGELRAINLETVSQVHFLNRQRAPGTALSVDLTLAGGQPVQLLLSADKVRELKTMLNLPLD